MAKLPVLMYHSVTSNKEEAKGLTIHKDTLEQQLLYLKKNGYNTLHFKDLESFKTAKDLPKRSVIISFDDVYVNQLELAYPLFKAHNLKACFYIPFKFVGGKNEWDEGKKTIMSIQQLQQLDQNIIELGMHSFSHINYSQYSLEKISEDLQKSEKFISENNLNIHQTIAYPYGKYPRSGEKKNQFFNLLKENNLKFGLRIGNRVNTFPFKNNYEIQRLDIKAEDTLLQFIWKLKVGKLF
jgi:peptidoglycan/xylan/chitin deacetylase (PgdA/CDA1 family)